MAVKMEDEQKQNTTVAAAAAAAAASTLDDPAGAGAAAARAGSYPRHPSLGSTPVSNPALHKSLSLISRSLDLHTAYASSLSAYRYFLLFKAEQSMMHGATPAFKELVVARQTELMQALPVATVHAFTEREGEIEAAAAAYKAHGLVPPPVERARIIPEKVRIVKPGRVPGARGGGGGGGFAAAGASYAPAAGAAATVTYEVPDPNAVLAPGSTVRTKFGAAELNRKNRYADAAANNPILSITDRQAALQAQALTGPLGQSSGWSSLSGARADARKAGTLLSCFPLVYSSFVSSLDTWFNPTDLARRVRVKEPANWLVWVECFGYSMPRDEESFNALPPEVRKDLEHQWREYCWRGIFPAARVDHWNRQLKREKLRIERDQDNRRLKMVALPGWVRLDTDPPEDPVPDSSIATAAAPPAPVAAPAPPPAAAAAPASVATNPAFLAILQTMPPGTNPQQVMILMMQMQLAAQKQQQEKAAAEAKAKADAAASSASGRVEPFEVEPPDDSVFVPNSADPSVAEVELDLADEPRDISALASSLWLQCPSPALPTGSAAKLGGRSLLVLILAAHMDRWHTCAILRALSSSHFPQSFAPFREFVQARHPAIASHPLQLTHAWEKYLVAGARTRAARQKLNAQLESEEGLQLQVMRGRFEGESLYRLVRIAGWQRQAQPGAAAPLLERLEALVMGRPQPQPQPPQEATIKQEQQPSEMQQEESANSSTAAAAAASSSEAAPSSAAAAEQQAASDVPSTLDSPMHSAVSAAGPDLFGDAYEQAAPTVSSLYDDPPQASAAGNSMVDEPQAYDPLAWANEGGSEEAHKFSMDD